MPAAGIPSWLMPIPSRSEVATKRSCAAGRQRWGADDEMPPVEFRSERGCTGTAGAVSATPSNSSLNQTRPDQPTFSTSIIGTVPEPLRRRWRHATAPYRSTKFGGMPGGSPRKIPRGSPDEHAVLRVVPTCEARESSLFRAWRASRVWASRSKKYLTASCGNAYCAVERRVKREGESRLFTSLTTSHPSLFRRQPQIRRWNATVEVRSSRIHREACREHAIATTRRINALVLRRCRQVADWQILASVDGGHMRRLRTLS